MSTRINTDSTPGEATISSDDQCAEIRLRPMVESDLCSVVNIESEAYSFPWSESIFRDCLRVGYCCLVLELQKVVEAYGIMSVAAGESHLLNLCVHPKGQGKGFGGRLLTQLLMVAREHHARTIMLEVRPSNPTAIRLYHGLGFNEVGIRRAYYPSESGREDALIFAMEL